ncbi:MAG TPA: HPF/RaiA family ribosome-associated protein [Polyangiaceae bacterium]|nr:HPF/RaiA family ribosome-associated protein [Polyangiaceae bacterium]
MKVDVRFHGSKGSERLREHAKRRIAFGFGRIAPEVSLVRVRLGDENGPRGGVDQRCHVTVVGPSFGQLEVEQLGADPFATVSSAVDRIARTTGRRLERNRPVRGGGSIRLPWAGGLRVGP